MDNGLTFRLLLAAAVAAVSIITLIVEHVGKDRKPLGWPLRFTLIGAGLAAILSYADLLNEAEQDKVDQKRFNTTLTRVDSTLSTLHVVVDTSNAIIRRLQHADSMQVIELAEQRFNADTTCRSIGVSIAKLEEQRSFLNAITSDLADNLERVEQVGDQMDALLLPLDSLHVRLILQYPIDSTEFAFYKTRFPNSSVYMIEVKWWCEKYDGACALLEMANNYTVRLVVTDRDSVRYGVPKAGETTFWLNGFRTSPNDIVKLRADEHNIYMYLEGWCHMSRGWLSPRSIRELENKYIHAGITFKHDACERDSLCPPKSWRQMRWPKIKVRDLKVTAMKGYTFDFGEQQWTTNSYNHSYSRIGPFDDYRALFNIH